MVDELLTCRCNIIHYLTPSQGVVCRISMSVKPVVNSTEPNRGLITASLDYVVELITALIIPIRRQRGVATFGDVLWDDSRRRIHANWHLHGHSHQQ